MRNEDFLVTKILIVANVIAFVVEIVLLGPSVLSGATNPSDMLKVGAMTGNQIFAKQYMPLFTSMFIHMSLIHIISNMMSLWILGRAVEPAIGSIKFLLFYVIAGLAGNLLSVKMANPNIVSAGASGAIFGIMGLEVGGLIFNKLASIGGSRSAAIQSIGEVIVLNLINSVLNPSINLWAHLGGLIAGFILAIFI